VFQPSGTFVKEHARRRIGLAAALITQLCGAGACVQSASLGIMTHSRS
jgi:hypothetical protein